MSWLFASGGQSIRTSASESVLPMSIHGWFPLRLTGLISLLREGSQDSSLKDGNDDPIGETAKETQM